MRHLTLALLLAACGGDPGSADGAAGDAAMTPQDASRPPRDMEPARVSDLARTIADAGNSPMDSSATVTTDSALALLDASAAASDAPMIMSDMIVPAIAQGIYTFTLDAGAFPPTSAHPSALVYVPTGFVATRPLSVIVFLHGFDNCVENVVRDTGQPCTQGMPARAAYNLIAQLEAAHKNALLVCPEVTYDASTGAAGNLQKAGGFKALLDETLRDLPAVAGAHLTAADVGRLMVLSHSGGYEAAATIANSGGIPVEELDLLDSLYGNFPDFDAWVKSDLPSITTTTRRFADVYTCCGGTEANSYAMATRAEAWVDGGVEIDDRGDGGSSTWTDPVYHHGLLFKFSGLTHDGVPRYYFGELVRNSNLPDKP